MSEHKCCVKIFKDWHNKPCGKNGKFEREGKHYCGTHDPVKAKEKNEARSKKWEAEWAASAKESRLANAAPELFAALKAIVLSADANKAAITDGLLADARTAIAKATGASS